ncbi:hypothetical protein BGZ60DRAFT_421639 [Tricladium varicosporioides]|nr:hypothetical protein BGZ60DRAFT_421639 [Hymenoscyphus varicosporioides]
MRRKSTAIPLFFPLYYNLLCGRPRARFCWLAANVPFAIALIALRSSAKVNTVIQPKPISFHLHNNQSIPKTLADFDNAS